MTVEQLRIRAEPRIDSSLEITLLFSLFGLTATLALLPLVGGGDFGTWLALAG